MEAGHRLVRIVCVALWFVSSAVWAGDVHLVRDINTTPIGVDSSPTDFANLGVTSFFDASDGAHGAEPWTTDGTPDGTFMWGDLTPGISGKIQRTVVQVGAQTFLSDYDLQLGSSLWVSDGTQQGTRRVKNDELALTTISDLGALGNAFALAAFDSTTLNAWALWLSDGTDAGTRKIFAAPSNNFLAASVIAGSKVYILNMNASGIIEPWVSDGTQSGTREIASIPGQLADFAGLPRLARAGNYVFFGVPTNTQGRELWRIDTRDDSISLVRDIAVGSDSSLAPSFQMGAVNNVVVFAADDGSGNRTAWRSDGTSAGTFQLANATPWASAVPAYMANGASTRLVFMVDRGGAQEWWATDGSTTGTVLLSHFWPSVIYPTASRFYFSNASGSELWTSDGTVAGTHQLTGVIAAGEKVSELTGTDSELYVRTRGDSGVGHIYRYVLASSQTTQLLSYSHELSLGTLHVFGYAQGRLYFDNATTVTGRELWTSDGTQNGTHLFKNLAPETQTLDSSPDDFIRFAGQLFFTADDGEHGREVWHSDGTFQGTQLLIDLLPGPTSSKPSDLFIYGDSLYFFARDAAGTFQLWRSNGTAAGTLAVRALQPRPTLRNPGCDSRAVTMGGSAFFAAYDDTAALQLWRTDGSSAATVSVATAYTNNEDFCELIAVDNSLYFRASSASGNELWRSDGTAGHATQVKDIASGTASSNPHALIGLRGAIYFIADNGVGARLWRSNGTDAGTRVAIDFAGGAPVNIAAPLADRLVVAVQEGPAFSSHSTLWETDGESAAKLSNSVSMFSNELSTQGPLIFFPGLYSTGSVGDVEPWVTDGTPAGTRLLLDTTIGLAFARSFTDFDGITVFNTSGFRLWRTDGTAAGTRLVGNAELSPQRLSAHRSLFFVTNNGTTGNELFAISNDRPIAAADTLANVQAGNAVQGNVLANDIDADGVLNPATLRIILQPAGGSVSVGSGGVITYTPRTNFSGTDTFSYSVADDQGFASDPATVTISVTAAPVAPGSNGEGGSSKSGGGGSMRLADLFAAFVFVFLVGRRGRARHACRRFRGYHDKDSWSVVWLFPKSRPHCNEDARDL